MGSQRARHDWLTNTITLSDWAGRVGEKEVSAVVTLFREPEVARRQVSEGSPERTTRIFKQSFEERI